VRKIFQTAERSVAFMNHSPIAAET